MSDTHVFISHSSSDRDWARNFANSLQSYGISVWLDELSLQAGESWEEAIEKALRESQVVVVLISKESVTQPNLLFEMGAAIGMGKKVIPIVPQNFDLSQLPPLRLKKVLIKRSPQATAEELAAETGALQAA